ncbi:hypothetical protein [Photobacterium arenosum]|uniref:hypothetical protein n=1 Tax=Photobacterium arenosum TaxID=2774143 RepID=UPI0028890B73|nr:hypothetical protein [Photobacterium arenosum]
MPRVYTRQWKPGDLRIHPGTLDDIPLGWELAEDMIDRAVVGAGGQYAKGQNFGGDSFRPAKPAVTVQNHTLTQAQMPAHNHNGQALVWRGTADAKISFKDYEWRQESAATSSAGSNGSHAHGVSVGEVGEVDTRQLSIAVIWIRKL